MGFWTVYFIYLQQMMRFMLRSAFTGTKLQQVEKWPWKLKTFLYVLCFMLSTMLYLFHLSISALGSKINTTAASSTRYPGQLRTSAHVNMSDVLQQSQEQALRDDHSTGMQFSRKQSPPGAKLGYFDAHSQEPMPTNNVPGTCDTIHYQFLCRVGSSLCHTLLLQFA